MAEESSIDDMPDLFSSTTAELQRRLGLVNEEIWEVCRGCNRRVSKRSEMVKHISGTKHNAVLDERAHRLTHHQLGMPYDEALFCHICGKRSPDAAGHRAHLDGKGHRECRRVETLVWSLLLAARQLREELARRGAAAAPPCPICPETEAANGGAMSGSQVKAGTVAAPCPPEPVKVSFVKASASAALKVVGERTQPIVVGRPVTQAVATADAVAALASVDDRCSPIGDAVEDENDGYGNGAILCGVEETLGELEGAVAGLGGTMHDVDGNVQAVRSELEKMKLDIPRLLAAHCAHAEEQVVVRGMLADLEGTQSTILEALQELKTILARPVSLQLRREL